VEGGTPDVGGKVKRQKKRNKKGNRRRAERGGQWGTKGRSKSVRSIKEERRNSQRLENKNRKEGSTESEHGGRLVTVRGRDFKKKR